MAWYEQTGPDAAAVRKSVKQHYIKNGNIGSAVHRLQHHQHLEFPQCYKIMADCYLDGILENRIIPNNLYSIQLIMLCSIIFFLDFMV